LVIAAMDDSAGTKLRKVANLPAITDEARRMLRQLATALDDKADLEAWAAVDLRVAFDPDTAIKPAASSTWLGRTLDVLVFTPVASTWLGLMVATTAYRETANDPNLKGENFLQRWQGGFDHHIWGGLTFDRVTLITFLLVALVLLLALTHFAFRTRADHGPKAKAYRLLSEALTAAERELAPVRLGAVGRVADEVGRVSAEVADTAAEIRKVGEVARRTQDAAADSIEEITTAITAVKAAAEGVADAVIGMGDKLEAATVATSAVAATEAEFGVKLMDATGKLDTTVGGLADRLTKAVSAGETQLAKAVTDSTEKVAATLSNSMAQVKGALGDSTVKVSGAIGDLTATATKNAGSVGTAVRSLGDVRDATLLLPAGLGELKAEVGGLQVEVGRLNEGIAALSRAIETMRVASLPSSGGWGSPRTPSRGSSGDAGRGSSSGTDGRSSGDAGRAPSRDAGSLWSGDARSGSFDDAGRGSVRAVGGGSSGDSGGGFSDGRGREPSGGAGGGFSGDAGRGPSDGRDSGRGIRGMFARLFGRE
jgi:hypothetical protein